MLNPLQHEFSSSLAMLKRGLLLLLTPSSCLCPCSYHGCPPAAPPQWTTFFEYCSNTKLTINHITLSPRRALPLCTPRPPHASHWSARLLDLPLSAGHRCNRTSRLLPWGQRLGERACPWAANHAPRCAPRVQRCSLRRAECGARRRAAYQQTLWSGSRLFYFFGQDAKTPSCSLRKTSFNQIIGRFECICLWILVRFYKESATFFKALRAKLSLSGIFEYSAVYFFLAKRDIKKKSHSLSLCLPLPVTGLS